MNREEHLAWCKKRALEYADRGDCQQAITSMASDIQKHDETRFNNPGMLSALVMVATFDLGNPPAIRRWINGFN